MSQGNRIDSISPRPPATLVLCFEGTFSGLPGSKSKPTNVIKFFELLDTNAGGRQVIYYQAGIGSDEEKGLISHKILGGTQTSPKLKSKVPSRPFPFRKFLMKLDQAFAISVATHVKQGYQFLVEHYQSGDKICLFGYSRGAYIARALAGMVSTVGLVPRGNENLISKAFVRYENASQELQLGFKALYAIDVDVEFIGAWDTVCSLGGFRRSLPLKASCKTFRHALALDERRIKFKAEHYNQSDNLNGADVKEVWFAGCHGDVGGGSVDKGKTSLADIPLRWIVLECHRAESDILFEHDQLHGVHINPEVPTRAPDVDEEAECPIHDPFLSRWLWGFLDFISFNGGRGRKIPAETNTSFFVHRSVRTRMNRTEYKPKAVNWDEMSGKLEHVD